MFVLPFPIETHNRLCVRTLHLVKADGAKVWLEPRDATTEDIFAAFRELPNGEQKRLLALFGSDVAEQLKRAEKVVDAFAVLTFKGRRVQKAIKDAVALLHQYRDDYPEEIPF